MNKGGVILNGVKNLKSASWCLQILRLAQDDTSFMLRVAVFVFFICFPFHSEAQEPFRVMFWNVENLFDTKDDPQKNDNEFLPDATRHWTYTRYHDKLTKVAKTIVASGREGVPDLVGLCEVENDSCLYDLTRRSLLREADYRYVMTDSPDRRGIDVALLYQRGTFKLISHQSIRIPGQEIKRGPTRDILHVVGQILTGEIVDVFVCHFPSRSEGKAKSEPYRLLAARTLRHTVDSLMEVRQHPYLIIMGDFNDYPTDKSMKEVLCGKGDLQNLMQGMEAGTYRYRGEWGIFDQFLVSENISAKNNFVKAKIKFAPAKNKNVGAYLENVLILRHPFLLEEDEKYGGDKPFRTFNGMKYNGGYSDHLPIVMDLFWNCHSER